ncbi:uncharacterized protein LOC141912596 [Tubulanus polymorphus]|uniref:uncharacterized protein LOC141912596 n=1 Tax=Tubulanus polymorphus TaxID=672921 RepID=UPI003DA23517
MPVSRVRINQCIGDCTDELWQILAELYQRIDTSIESLCLSLRHVISEHRDKKRRCLDDVLSVAVDDERTKIFATSKSMIDQYQSSLLESLHATFEVLKDEVDRKTELLSANVIKDDESLLGKIFKQRSALYDYISESMCSYSTLLQRHCNQLKKLLELFHESAIHKTERIVTTMNQALDDSADLCTNQIREMFRLLTMKSYEIHGETIGIVTRNKRILVDSTTTRTIPVAERQCQNLVQILNVDSESLLVHWEENRASFVAVSSESFQQLIRDVTDRKSALIRLVDENEAWLRAEFRDSVVTATENITKYNEKLIENVTMNCENFFIESSLIPSRFDSPSTTTDDNPDSGKSRQCEIISCSSSGVDLKRIIRGLTRNCDDVSDLLMMTYNKQQTAAANHHHKQQFDVSSVNCYCLQGSISVKPTVVDGIILPASTDVISIIQQDNSTDYNILLIAGDLKSSWKHTGHKDSVNSSVTTDVETISQTRETWIDQCVLILKNLNVKAVLVQGEVDLNLLLTLNSKNFAIAVIHHVPYKVLRTISTATKTELTTYIRDVNKYNVASGIKLSVWRADWMDSDSLLPYIIVDCGHPTWTAVSCHPASALLRHKEEQFLHCAYRLQYAIERGVVLPGAGSTEQHSIQILKQLIDNCEISNRTLVFEMMIEVFNEFIEKIRQNSENQSATSDDLIGGRGIVVTYDDAVTKAAVWRTAANAVTTLIYTDIEIITGIEDYKLKLL